MTISGGDVIADILKNHQVPFVFTLCGGHISPILVGAKAKGIRVIDVRSEADAFARLTGIPGVAAVTAGPGVTNTITAMKNAQMAQSPVVLLGGAAATVVKGRGSLQDIDQISLLRSVVKQAASIKQNRDIVPVLENAFQTARSGVPGPVFVECPVDLLYGEELVREWYGANSDPDSPAGDLKSERFRLYLEHHVNRLFACDFKQMKPEPIAIESPKIKPDKAEKASRLLRESSRPVLVVGSQAMLNQTEIAGLQSAVDSLGIPVYLTGMARGLMGKNHTLQLRHGRKEALKSADLVLLAGMPCDFRLDYGRSVNSRAKLISVNRSESELNLNRIPDLGVQGDPFAFIRSLSESFKDDEDRFGAWLAGLRRKDDERTAAIKKMASSDSNFINPLRFFFELDDFLDDKSVIVADGGDFVGTASYILNPRGPLGWLDPGVFGTLGVGAGFAMGAKLSKPDHEVWLIYGDGAAGYSLQEIDSFARHGLPVIVVIGNDGAWTQVARDQAGILKDDVATVLRRSDYHKVAAGFGADGYLLDKTENIRSVLRKARESASKGIPAVINVMIDKTDFRKGSISIKGLFRCKSPNLDHELQASSSNIS